MIRRNRPGTMDMKSILEQLADGVDLSQSQSRSVFDQIMAGRLETPVITELLVALRTKGESVDEIIGAAQAMRANMVNVTCDAPCIDTCGTGGDGVSTFNVSTTAAIIASAAGAIVAKHGNRSTTRSSGSTEVLTELGIDVEAEHATVERCLSEVGIGYLNARRCHPAMRFAAPSRQALPGRTIFNLLGPLTNPAGAKRQVIGVPKPELIDLVAQAIQKLGTDLTWVVHGLGLCDLTITGATEVAQVTPDTIHRFTISPEDVGLTRASVDELTISSPAQSAKIVEGILDGARGAQRDHALMNSGGALVVAGIASTLEEGVNMAGSAIDSQRARDTLLRWRKIAGID